MSPLRLIAGDAHEALKGPLTGISAGSLIAAIGHVDWAVIGPIVGGLVFSIGGAVVGLVERVQVKRRKLELLDIEVAMARRRLAELPVDRLDPAEVAREAREIDADGAKAGG